MKTQSSNPSPKSRSRQPSRSGSVLKPNVHFQRLIIIYHWSLAINKIQRIMKKRCRQPLRDLLSWDLNTTTTNYKSDSNISYLHGKRKKMHMRYISEQLQNINEDSFEEAEFFFHKRSPSDTQGRTQKDIKPFQQFRELLSERNTATSSKHIFHHDQMPCVLDSFHFNEAFLTLFEGDKRSSQFGKLSPRRQVEQQMLLRKLNDSNPSRPKSDLHTFLELVKKPKLDIPKEIAHQQQARKNEPRNYFCFLLFLLPLIGVMAMIVLY